MDYVQVQVPPLDPSLPRPRFSLYLSSQLQYGVVIVYHRQCAFLLEEVQNTIERFLRSERFSQIDVQELDRLALDIPDSLFLLEEAEGAIEPFFGVMGVECELPTPCLLPQSWRFMETSSPLRPHHLVTSLTVSPEAITIKDKEPESTLTPEFGGMELPEATAQEVEMLMQQEDTIFLPGEVEDKERGREAEAERGREAEAVVVSTELLKESASENRTLIMEDTGYPLEAVKNMVALEMTPPPLPLPATRGPSEHSLEQTVESQCSSSETPAPEGVVLPENRRHHRKRQLIFADHHTQISQEAMREQISNPKSDTRALSDVLLQAPPLVRFSASALLSSPCNSLTHPDLRSLWKQCCVPAPLPSGRGPREDSELSEMQTEPPVDEDRKWRRNESSREVLRESSEAGLLLSEVSAASDLVLDESKGDKSQSDLITPISRRSPMDEAAVYMEAILEECVEMPQVAETGEVTPQVPPEITPEITLEASADTLIETVNTYIDRFGKILFYSLLPLEADRRDVAHVFYKVLELVCLKKLLVRQTEPYGLITLTHSPLHTHT
ncbi:REC8 meiotic recombination protein b isoform X2 [Brachyhypopomus gauderio]